MNRALLTLAVALFAASEARADLPPFWPGTKYAHVTYEISTQEFLRDHVLILVHHDWQRERGVEFVTLVVGSPVRVTTAYRDERELLIVSRHTGAEYATAAELASAVKAGRVQAVRHWFGSRETVPSWSSNEITIRYEVRRDKTGSGLEVVRASRTPLLSWYVAATLFCAALVFGGFWFVRRIFRRAFRPVT